MPKITRLTGNNDWIDLDFVERERTPEPAMKLGIQMHLAELSLSNTVSVLDELGVKRSRKAVHDWVQKADLQPSSGKAPNQVAVDETVIRINDQQYWLYAAADSAQTNFSIFGCFPPQQPLSPKFFSELRQKHDVDDAVFLVDGTTHHQAALHRSGLRFQTERHGNRNSAERIFREVKRRTSSFSNCFSHVEPETAENWLQSFARWHNAPN
jgi:putative transposase